MIIGKSELRRDNLEDFAALPEGMRPVLSLLATAGFIDDDFRTVVRVVPPPDNQAL